MKQVALIFSGILFSIALSAQNANPFVSISMSPYEVGVNKSTHLEISAGNASNDIIAAGSLKLTITAGANSSIKEMDQSSDKRWKVVSITKGNGNTMVLGNTGSPGFGSFDLAKIDLVVEGTKIGGPDTYTGYISYVDASASSQGNTSSLDDKSTTSLIVLATPPVKLPVLTAAINDCNVTLSWQKEGVKTEEFEVQYCTDDYTFSKLASVSAKNDKTYSYTTEHRGTGFYRLRMIDKSGKELFSKSIRVETKCLPKKGFTP